MNIIKAVEMVLELANQKVLEDPKVLENLMVGGESSEEQEALRWVRYYLDNFLKKGKH